ncbi:MAG: hypothetical protein M1834_007385 [Cirrosporium novae-zelandiae]|nr:MAG: hypothetical protein M1834_007385 [Cirrosporium novae-zelandiae]
MASPVGVGDIMGCAKLAYKVYDALKNAPQEFQDLRMEVLGMRTTLKSLSEDKKSGYSLLQHSPPQKEEDLKMLIQNCYRSLDAIQILLTRYSSLKEKYQRGFSNRVKFAWEGKQLVREKLATHTANLNIFLTSMTHSSLGRIEQSLDDRLGGAWTVIGRDIYLGGANRYQIQHVQDHIKQYVEFLLKGGVPFSDEELGERLRRGSAGIERENKAPRESREEYRDSERRGRTENLNDRRYEQFQQRETIRKTKEEQKRLAKLEADEKVKERLIHDQQSSQRAVDDLVKLFNDVFETGEDIMYTDPNESESFPSSPEVEAAATDMSPSADDDTYIAHEDETTNQDGDNCNMRNAREKLKNLMAKQKEAERTGDLTRAEDLRLNAIPAIHEWLSELEARATQYEDSRPSMSSKEGKPHTTKTQPVPGYIFASPAASKSKKNKSVQYSCNFCESTIENVRFHCKVCNGGTYDLCEGCVESGRQCPGGHVLKQRSA